MPDSVMMMDEDVALRYNLNINVGTPTNESLEQASKHSSSVDDTSATSTISAKMKVVADVVSAVSSGLNANPVYATFLHFEVNSLVVDTTSTDPNKSIAMSFEIKKNGSGMANSFTVRIAYAPGANSSFNPNEVEEKLETAMNAQGVAFSSRYCKLKYGYAKLNGTSQITPEYTGLLMDYSVELQDGILMYTLTGYSGLSFWKESKENIILYPENGSKIKPTASAKQIVNNYLSGNDANLLSDKTYSIVFDEGVEGSDVEVDLSTITETNPATALTEVLNAAVHESQIDALEKDQLKDDELITYEWFVSDRADDENGAGVIFITMEDPNKEEEADANLIFNWMTPANGGINHIVLSFKPEFQGVVRLAQAAKALNPKDSEGNYIFSDDELHRMSYFVNDEGELIDVPKSFGVTTGGDKKTVVINMKKEKSSWVRAAQYPYKASMVTMGIPCEIPITGRIKVVPMIYGNEHNSAGIYQVHGVTDIIDSGGTFTTAWELFKRVKADDESSSAGESAASSKWAGGKERRVSNQGQTHWTNK